ncbi:hypothetical protein [Nocardia sp. N2S4-5]|uniref:hypothetical protein n=1 Tax=Nocardia sp. N2S4-5 TaxID=3351565 RepID=UPI0037CE1D0B
MSDPLEHNAFVYADGMLAEVMCQVHLMELTFDRALELRHVHRFHHPDECIVHLEAAHFLMAEDGC